MSARRDRRWWKERWVSGYYAELKTPELLLGLMRHKDLTVTRLARLASYERISQGGRKVSHQMISQLVNGQLKSCRPDLAAAIERVLDVPDHFIFTVLPKSPDKRHDAKADAA